MSRALGSDARKVLLSQYADKVSEGEYAVRLDQKAWGKSMSLWCFFTVIDTEEKIAINCFRTKGVYGPRDQSIDFSITGNEGSTYKIKVAVSSKGYMNLSSAEIM